MKKRAIALDPRLLVGVGLVVVSVVGVMSIVSTVDKTVEVYVAPAPLAPGDTIRASDLDVARVRLDADRYLVPGRLPSEGVVVSRVVGAGELVPVSATGSSEGVRVTSVVVSVGGELPESVAAGSVVDVWAAAASESGQFGEPRAIVSAATVVRIVQSQSIVGAGQATAVEVLVARSRVARVLAAIANDDALAIVPATLPVSN